jgi:hypothetical protein
MSDTSHHHAAAGSGPTEGDGVNYRGIVWFVAILAGTTFACQLLMWGMFAFMDRQAAKDDAEHPSLALPYGEASADCVPVPTPEGAAAVGRRPCILKNGQVDPGRQMPQPNLMADDPLGLKVFRAKEDQILENYDVMDKNAGTYRIPIDRAKDLLIQRGIPGGTVMPAAPAPAVKK